ncbi:DUF1398 family protein [Solitalea canadensis]|uniref:Phage envelope protein n=1 Tax=Solitalea canadensis (strain ATCC 29591 / DSM 3403 / JCM 21819 / LMG 8368 / NBRC 15130 / NCIMB 12057 / USAM 9D) TaxID=929556 RepID=H8KU29_SOLCM|nr:DUF1398 family protein [Solitalea canadensis]AFD07009.1 phage envelope protein [Solitalea canadensis DSM 3403]
MSLHDQIQHVYKTASNYPELVRQLIEVGIQSYTVDVATGSILYRLEHGHTHLHEGTVQPRSIEEKFNRELTIKAIRDNQQGKTTYPEFMDGIAQAGVRFYEATLSGNEKRVTYIGYGGLYEEVIPV